METVKLFFGPLESLVSNPLPKYKHIEIEEETREAGEEGEQIENKKLIFKENFAVFSLENVDPSNFFKKNSTVEMVEDNFWDFVFSDEWSNFSTLRLTSGSVLKDLIIHLEDLTKEGCIESETITHFDDHLTFPQGRLSGEDVKARIQMRIYKWPESKLKICVEGNETPPVKESLRDEESNVSKSTAKKSDSKGQEINKLLQNFSLSLIYHSIDSVEADEPLVKDSEFDEFYFPKSFSNPTSRTRHASLDSYLKMRLLLKKSKHWTERSEENAPVHYVESKDNLNKSNLATKISAENKKVDKMKKKENKAPDKTSKISAPNSEQATDVNESKSVEEEIEKIFSRKPLWISFEEKMNEALNEEQLEKEEHNDDDSAASRGSKNKQKKETQNAKKKKENLISKESDLEILTKPPQKPRVVAKVSYADERIPVCVTKQTKRCPDTIVLRETCRSETLWSLPTPARIKCGESKLHFFPWRSVCPLECQRFKEELRNNLQDDLTELWNLGQDDESSSNEDGQIDEEKEPQVCFKHLNPCPTRREDRRSCRSVIKREINKLKNRKGINKAPPGDSFENVEEVQSSSSFVVGAMGFVREKSGEYLLAAMRRYQVRKEIVSISISTSNKVESVTCLTFNRPWRNNFTFCCKQCINKRMNE